jgi:predicted alpha/beta-fold hydrolase
METMKQSENEFIVLGDLPNAEDEKRRQLDCLFHELTGRSVKEYLADLVEYVREGDRWAAVLDLKNITGEHLAECNEFYQALKPGCSFERGD